jgi:hypothetical protein
VPFFNSSSLHRAFADAPLLPVSLPSKPTPALPASAHREVLVPREGAASPAPTAETEPTGFRVTKVGQLSRKDLVVEGGKRAPSRKWREWSVVLTGSQLLFFVRRCGLAWC